MRYVNNGAHSSYCSPAGKSLKPGEFSRELGEFSDFLKRIESDARAWGILLSEEERLAVGRVLALSADTESRLRPGAARRPEPRWNPTALTDAIRSVRQAQVDELVRKSGERQARINAESVFVGPDGRPVQQTGTGVASRIDAMAKSAKPKVVDDPMSALDIFSHNAAMTKIRAEEPLTGRAAVEASPYPGMPSLPGAAETLDETAREARLVADAINGRK